MSIRSINLKMILDRGAEGEPVRRQLWTTHQTINTAVREVEHFLLLMRGERYRIDDDDFVSREKVQQDALQFARETQERNSTANQGTDDIFSKTISCGKMKLARHSE